MCFSDEWMACKVDKINTKFPNIVCAFLTKYIHRKWMVCIWIVSKHSMCFSNKELLPDYTPAQGFPNIVCAFLTGVISYEYKLENEFPNIVCAFLTLHFIRNSMYFTKFPNIVCAFLTKISLLMLLQYSSFQT